MRGVFTPRWIAMHVAVVAGLTLMVSLGFWQLGRLDDRRELNELVAARVDLPAVDLADALAAGDDPEGLRYLNVTAAGQYVEDSVLVANRSTGGAPGSWVATPFATDSHTILVVRGFLDRPVAEAATLDSVAPPTGPLQLAGFLSTSPATGRFATGRVDPLVISHPDVTAISTQFGLPLVGSYLVLEDPLEPAFQSIERPGLDEGPHLSYAVQWFLFASVLAIGYPMVMFRSLRPKPGDAAVER